MLRMYRLCYFYDNLQNERSQSTTKHTQKKNYKYRKKKKPRVKDSTLNSSSS